MIKIEAEGGAFLITYEHPVYGVVAQTKKPTLREAIEDLVAVFKDNQDQCIAELAAHGLIQAKTSEVLS